MVFHSLVFVPFALAFFACYFISRRFSQHQKVILLFSAIFYGWWEWRFLGLMALSTGVDYFAAIKIEESDEIAARKKWLWMALGTNLAILFVFKYLNFFSGELVAALNSIGITAKPGFLDLILPVGISFYTFQSMGYAIDVYSKEVPAEKNVISYLSFIMFFPQLVAGPIEKASELLPQLREPAKVTREDVRSGLLLLLIGYFKKIVLAERLSPFVTRFYDHSHEYQSGWTFVVGTYFIIVFIYFDFSGYCNIASGLARLMGIRLKDNFQAPFVANSPSEFFQRWHISFSNWVKTYLLFPLTLRTGKIVFSLFVALLMMGLWHGASITFALYGIAIFVMTMFFALITRFQNMADMRFTPAFFAFRKIFMMTVFLFFAATLIRVRALKDFWYILTKVLAPGGLEGFVSDIARHTFTPGLGLSDFLISVAFIIGIFIFQSIQDKKPIDEFVFSKSKAYQFVFVCGLLLGLFFFRPIEVDGNYFYFQF